MKILKTFFFLLFAFCFVFFPVAMSAQQPTPTPNLQGGQGDLTWTIDGQTPENAYVDGTFPYVEIKFFGLRASNDYWLFPKTKQEDVKSAKKLTKVSSGGDGTYTIRVCGAGTDALKGSPVGKACRDNGSDYFHEGNVYRLGIYDDEDGQAQVMVAQFYVYHSAPIIKVSKTTRGTLPALKVELAGRRFGTNVDNNYELVLKKDGEDITDKCREIKDKGQKTIKMTRQDHQTDFITPNPAFSVTPIEEVFGQTQTSGLQPGDYLLRVNSQNHDTGLGINVGIGLGAPTVSNCSGGFTYVDIPLKITENNITVNDKEVRFDPSDIDGLNVEKIENFSPAPCAKVTTYKGKDGEEVKLCQSVRTAIGDVSVTMSGFVKSLFEFVLLLATFGGIIIIIYAGYIMMTSRGDKEKLQASRETLTSAIVGLLFIILSIVILEIIGVDILQIPGFGRTP